MGIDQIAELIGAYGVVPILAAIAAYYVYKYLPNLIGEIKQANGNSVKIVMLADRITAIEDENKNLKVEYKELETKYEHQGIELGELKTAYAVLKERFENLQERFEDRIPQSRGKRVA